MCSSRNLLVVLMILAGEVSAAPLSNDSFIEASFFEDLNLGLGSSYVSSGTRLTGNYALTEHVYLTMGWERGRSKIDLSDDHGYWVSEAEYNWLLPGAGMRLPVSDSVQFAGELVYLHLKGEYSYVYSLDDNPVTKTNDTEELDGAALKLLAQWRPVELIELELGAQRVHVEGGNSDSYFAGIRLHVSSWLSFAYKHEECDVGQVYRQHVSARVVF